LIGALRVGGEAGYSPKDGGTLPRLLQRRTEPRPAPEIPRCMVLLEQFIWFKRDDRSRGLAHIDRLAVDSRAETKFVRASGQAKLGMLRRTVRA